MMLDLLHRSRMQFPGMAMGFIHRLLDESLDHARDRKIGGRPLIGYDQVQHRLSRLQSYYTITSAMCLNSAEVAGIEHDLSGGGLEANSVKSVVTDLMQDAAQSATQLVGAQAYKLDHIAGRGITDSRPFQIFEGSNDILYAQIAEAIVKTMKKARNTRLFDTLKAEVLTQRSADRLKKFLDFDLSLPLLQRKLVQLGAVVGRIVSADLVLKLGDKGYRSDLIEQAIQVLDEDIISMLTGFNQSGQPLVVDDYRPQSDWRSFLP